MQTTVATHSGPFHADDVLAIALLRVFLDENLRVVRSRRPEDWKRADIVLDVGGVFAPDQRRFDHHQVAYTGALSSAGMVLDWLEREQKVTPHLASHLRSRLVDYVDEVDNGRVAPDPALPCFSSLVAACSQGAGHVDDHDAAFLRVATFSAQVVRGLTQAFQDARAARSIVERAMEDAVNHQRAVIYLGHYCRWKPAYFELGGANHPTDYVVFPSDSTWRLYCIPVAEDSFQNKRDLPASWGGRTDEELSRIIGVEGAMFCHKNLFLSVFDNREALVEALESWGLMRRPPSVPADE
ncbi:MAG: MYG1 family protein [Myxococcota bacterium]|nr:MYG1 family protein [Myxococcota bacterium]